MKFKAVILTLLVTFFIGCNSDEVDDVNGGVNSSSIAASIHDTPQPQVEDESLRPPRAPSL